MGGKSHILWTLELSRSKHAARIVIIRIKNKSIMYINIPTDPALVEIAAYLRDPETQKQFPHFKAEMLIAALEIVMQNSLIKCGDHFVKQISGTAMGKPCAPPWANLYQALHELKFRNDWIAQVPIYIRFIDDTLVSGSLNLRTKKRMIKSGNNSRLFSTRRY